MVYFLGEGDTGCAAVVIEKDYYDARVKSR